ncbi:MAG: cysteine--tRNA ligase [Alphaproteobacteria bacterium]|nr:cysteine--tRNA ligase [Alphaproteobacteria bacterium]MDY4689037.1 cysteine--tRNA ligase [Alphaproteobacteria bacterium]
MPEIYLHNTLKQRKDKFIPIDADNVRMYVCGPTVYDKAHLGNAKTPVVYDVLYRLLCHVYGKEHVTYVSNITDVDDKILNKHKETGKSIREITEQTYNWYIDDMTKLNVLSPNYRPRATEYIPEMIKLVELLLKNGHAYIADKQVLFDVDSMPNYGFLSGRSMKEMVAGARVEIADYKKNPADFILWKPSGADQPGWDSPWGYGRPGWHLECSAMSSKLLGNDFDIHGGGSDLIFPHHENECAQSCCAYPGTHFAHYWVHTGMLMINGVKMSKSLGNFYTVDEILAKYPAEALRLLFLTTHYHQPFNFTFEGLEQAKNILDKFYNALLKNADIPAEKTEPSEKLIAALCDDLNTPLALSYLHETLGNLNKAETKEERIKYKSELLANAYMLGLLYNDAESWFKGTTDAEDTEIEALIAKRAEAKKNKDWVTADAIRNELKERGIVLEDSPTGTTWKKL